VEVVAEVVVADVDAVAAVFLFFFSSG